MKTAIIFISLALLIGFNSCKSKKPVKTDISSEQNNKTDQTKVQGKDPSISPGMDISANTQPRNFLAEGYTKGVIIDKRGLDGCKFLIQIQDSSFLQPNSLEEKFQENNKKVWFKYSVKKGAMSTCMSGKMVEIDDIVDRWFD